MYQNAAFEYADKIKSGEMDPEDIDVRELVYDDETHLTPELEELLTPEQREEFARLQRDKIDERASENIAERSADIQTALDALSGDDSDTDEVYINESDTITVKAYLDEHREDIFRNSDLTLSEDFDKVLEILEWVIEDEQYANPEVWRAFKRERGRLKFNEMFWRIVEPALKQYEAVAEAGNSDGTAVDN